MPRPARRKLKPEIRAIVEWAETHGWKIQDGKDGNDHWVLKHPTDGTVRLADTPGEYRGFANARAEIRRKSGLPSDSGPAAKYRHEPRQERFDMDAAVREARLRRAQEEVDALARQRRYEALEEELGALSEALSRVNPRNDPMLARMIAKKIARIKREMEDKRP